MSAQNFLDERTKRIRKGQAQEKFGEVLCSKVERLVTMEALLRLID
jgi:hypothetical protein